MCAIVGCRGDSLVSRGFATGGGERRSGGGVAPAFAIVDARACLGPLLAADGDFARAAADVLCGVVVGLSRVGTAIGLSRVGAPVGGFAPGAGDGTIGRTGGGLLGAAFRDELCDAGDGGGCAPIAAFRDELCDAGVGGGALIGLLRGPPIGDCGALYGDPNPDDDGPLGGDESQGFGAGV